MTGAEHYEASERCLTLASDAATDPDVPEENVHRWLGTAQVHATLALAAATAHSPVRQDFAYDRRQFGGLS